MSETIIAIDFGTTNTYITLCPSTVQNKTVFKLKGAKNAEISTVLLYSDLPNADPKIFPLISDMATQTFGKSTHEVIQTKKYRYASHFKPNIAAGGEPRQNAIDFFRAILRDAGSTLLPRSCRVLIGVPCEANVSFRYILKEIAEEAGFGKVELIEEAKGALLNDVGIGLYPLDELLAGYLVIDFGGGTCDFAFIRDGRVDPKYHWGDMDLGGQLFDDLFFQWFCDQNPAKAEELFEKGRDFLVRTFHCRQAKEKFSEYIFKIQDEPFDLEIGLHYGELKNLTITEFLERAKRYIPSQSLRDHYKKIKHAFPKKLEAGPVDLIQWFKDSLRDGMKSHGLRAADIHVVSLAGGSSLWFFVKECCEEVFPNARIATNPAPFAAISEGLAILPALQEKFKQTRTSVVTCKDGFVEKEIRPQVQKSFDKCRDKIVGRLLSELFDGKIKPILLDYRNEGGTIASMKQKVEQAVEEYDSILTDHIETTFRNEFDGLFDIAVEKTTTWLNGFGLRMIRPAHLFSVGHEKINVGGAQLDFGAQIANAIAAFVGGITAAIVASICGGTGTALVMAGPIGLLIGAVLAVVVALPVYIFLGNKTQAFVEQKLSIPSFITYRTLTDASISKSRKKMKDDLTEKITEVGKAPVNKLVDEMDRFIRREIDQLDLINLF